MLLIYTATVAALLFASSTAAHIAARPSLRLVIAASHTVGLAVVFIGLSSMLSHPKPVSLEWWFKHVHQVEEATVVASVTEEGEAIHVWLQIDEVEPRAYVLPWNKETAEELQEARRKAEQQGRKLMMRYPFEPSLEDREAPQFYLPPQPAMPPKELFTPSPEVEEHGI